MAWTPSAHSLLSQGTQYSPMLPSEPQAHTQHGPKGPKASALLLHPVWFPGEGPLFLEGHNRQHLHRAACKFRTTEQVVSSPKQQTTQPPTLGNTACVQMVLSVHSGVTATASGWDQPRVTRCDRQAPKLTLAQDMQPYLEIGPL